MSCRSQLNLIYQKKDRDPKISFKAPVFLNMNIALVKIYCGNIVYWDITIGFLIPRVLFQHVVKVQVYSAQRDWPEHMMGLDTCTRLQRIVII